MGGHKSTFKKYQKQIEEEGPEILIVKKDEKKEYADKIQRWGFAILCGFRILMYDHDKEEVFESLSDTRIEFEVLNE